MNNEEGDFGPSKSDLSVCIEDLKTLVAQIEDLQRMMDGNAPQGSLEQQHSIIWNSYQTRKINLDNLLEPQPIPETVTEQMQFETSFNYLYRIGSAVMSPGGLPRPPRSWPDTGLCESRGVDLAEPEDTAPNRSLIPDLEIAHSDSEEGLFVSNSKKPERIQSAETPTPGQSHATVAEISLRSYISSSLSLSEGPHHMQALPDTPRSVDREPQPTGIKGPLSHTTEKVENAEQHLLDSAKAFRRLSSVVLPKALHVRNISSSSEPPEGTLSTHSYGSYDEIFPMTSPEFGPSNDSKQQTVVYGTPSGGDYHEMSRHSAFSLDQCSTRAAGFSPGLSYPQSDMGCEASEDSKSIGDIGKMGIKRGVTVDDLLRRWTTLYD